MQTQYSHGSNGSLYMDMQIRRRQEGATPAMVADMSGSAPIYQMSDRAASGTQPAAAAIATFDRSDDAKRLKNITMENAVVVFSRKGCCMSYVITRLLCSLGVNPTAVEVEEEAAEMESIPAVFIGGRLLGGVDRLLAAHIAGNLVPQLKEAGALWL